MPRTRLKHPAGNSIASLVKTKRPREIRDDGRNPENWHKQERLLNANVERQRKKTRSLHSNVAHSRMFRAHARELHLVLLKGLDRDRQLVLVVVLAGCSRRAILRMPSWSRCGRWPVAGASWIKKGVRVSQRHLLRIAGSAALNGRGCSARDGRKEISRRRKPTRAWDHCWNLMWKLEQRERKREETNEMTAVLSQKNDMFSCIRVLSIATQTQSF